MAFYSCSISTTFQGLKSCPSTSAGNLWVISDDYLSVCWKNSLRWFIRTQQNHRGDFGLQECRAQVCPAGLGCSGQCMTKLLSLNSDCLCIVKSELVKCGIKYQHRTRRGPVTMVWTLIWCQMGEGRWQGDNALFRYSAECSHNNKIRTQAHTTTGIHSHSDTEVSLLRIYIRTGKQRKIKHSTPYCL